MCVHFTWHVVLLLQGVTSVNAYLPDARWYDYYTVCGRYEVIKKLTCLRLWIIYPSITY